MHINIDMDCNSSSHVHGSPASKLVGATLDNHDDADKGKRCLDRWSERKRSPLFNMFCWFCFSSSSDSDDESEDGVVASMVSAENHFRNVKALRLSS